MILIRKIVLESLIWNIWIFAKHMSSRDNYLSDALSRGQNFRFRYLANRDGKIFSNKEEVPDYLKEPEKIWIK